jgi:hypothetical protein
MSARGPKSEVAGLARHVRSARNSRNRQADPARPKVPTCDIERAGRPKEKAARRRLSILIVVDQAAINAGFDFGRWAALADNDF